MKRRSIFTIVLSLILCVCLAGCLEDLPASDLPQSTTTEATAGAAGLPTEESTTAPTEATETTTAVPTTEATTAPITEPTTEPVHLHEYLAATCTAPKTCASCGETTGSALGHNWKAATCTSPKVCTRCNTSSGSVAEHQYSNGICKKCGSVSESVADGDPDNDDSNGSIVYRTPTGKRYHLDPDCGGKNSYQVTLSQATSAGLTPCKKCAT